MKITVDISMYPLSVDYKPVIKDFIRHLRRHEGLKLVTNQLSTQINGEFDAVTVALNACLKQSMEQQNTVVFVTRYLNVDLDVTRSPQID